VESAAAAKGWILSPPDDVRPDDSQRSQQMLERLMAERRQKLERLRDAAIEPYPYRYDRTHSSAELRADEERLSGDATLVRVAGRLMGKRGMGKTLFAPLQDDAGSIQIYFKRDDLGPERFHRIQKLVDIGDWIGVEGALFRTRTGELTVRASDFSLLSKALRPLPEKYHEMSLELKSRRRYLDLAMNLATRERYRRRAAVTAEVRAFLAAEGFLEVETPVLQPLYGGATARPFRTVHNALDTTLYLRIADELYLKRLIVGGLGRVYEIAKDFRNEGIDRTHNPEFTMLECYAAFWDYTDMMALTERLIGRLGERFGRDGRIRYGEHEVDLSPPFRRLRYLDGLRVKIGRDPTELSDAQLRELARRHGLELPAEGLGRDRLLDALFTALVEPALIQPTFVLDHPKELSPLAKTHRDDPELVERFELFVAGFELANSFSELNDPEEQRARFLAQKALLDAGDEEAQRLDEDFLEALEHGMPPTGGLGVGFDRLVMLLTDSHSIREVLLFPQLRPEGEPARQERPPDVSGGAADDDA
jgi:lysyl-tRNA synthetase class 2